MLTGEGGEGHVRDGRVVQRGTDREVDRGRGRGHIEHWYRRRRRRTDVVGRVRDYFSSTRVQTTCLF